VAKVERDGKFFEVDGHIGISDVRAFNEKKHSFRNMLSVLQCLRVVDDESVLHVLEVLLLFLLLGYRWPQILVQIIAELPVLAPAGAPRALDE